MLYASDLFVYRAPSAGASVYCRDLELLHGMCGRSVRGAAAGDCPPLARVFGRKDNSESRRSKDSTLPLGFRWRAVIRAELDAYYAKLAD